MTVREHYQMLMETGFQVFQGNDPVDEDDFVAISEQGGRVDMVRHRPNGTVGRWTNVLISTEALDDTKWPRAPMDHWE